MKIVTEKQLKEVLKGIKGARAITIVAHTDARCRKTGNPFAMPITKRSHVNGMINWIYANSVNNQRCREDQPIGADGEVEHFEAQPRRWGVRLKGLPFVEHEVTKALYLELKVQRSVDTPQYFDANGKALTAEQVAPFLPKRRKSNTQKVDRDIILRDYGLDKIEAVTVNGEDYVVEGKSLILA